MKTLLDNKSLYKLFLGIIKYVPIILALFQTIGTILNYLGMPALAISCLGGSSILFLIVLFLIAGVFKFCYLYKIPLVYNTVMVTLKIIDSSIGIPLDTLILFRLHFVILGVFIILFVYYMYKNRGKPKVDYISSLCRRYECC